MADDLNRWLRAVRPHTKADDDWAESAEANDALESIHARIDSGPRRWVRAWPVWFPSVGVAGIAAALITAIVVSSPAPVVPPTSNNPQALAPIPINMRPVAQVLKHYDSCGQLLKGLRSHTVKSVGAGSFQSYPYYGGMAADGAFPPAALPQRSGFDVTNQGGKGAQGSSSTNVQEIGVDEPDTVKTDGDRIVSVVGGKLRVVSASTRTVIGSLDLTLYANWQSAQLLTSGMHAIVILGGFGYGYFGGDVAYRGGYPAPSAQPSSTILTIDLSHEPTVTQTLQITGSYVDARMVGTTARIVAVNGPNIVVPYINAALNKQAGANAAIIGKAPLSAWLPSYTISSRAGTTTKQVPCSAVSHPAEYSGQSMLTVYTVDVVNPGDDLSPISVAADASTVYGTQSSLYVASQPCFGKCDQGTQIHRFDIRGAGRPTYLGSGTVPGSLLNSYSMSDYEGHLRIATTVGAANAVYVLDDNTLKQTGSVGGLGKGERLYAVRFVGSLGFVVTFRQIDPLYVIDLSDPSAPETVGELKITGYSSYLHDVGDGRLVGVGQEASTQGRVSGLQVSLFDVSKPSDPQRLDRDYLAGSPGEGQFDPHAFLYWEPTGLVAVPVQSWQGSDMGKVLVLRVEGSTLKRVGLVANPDATASGYQYGGIMRSMIVDGQLWTLSNGGIRVTDPSTLDQEAWIEFS